MEDRIEYIIKSKTFLELTAEERELIREWAKDEIEFDQLKQVFVSVEQLNNEVSAELNPTIKQRLDVRFNERFAQRRLAWYNRLRLFLWPQDVSFARKPLIHLAAIAIVIAVVSPYLFIDRLGNEQVAMIEREEDAQKKSLQSEKLKDVVGKKNEVANEQTEQESGQSNALEPMVNIENDRTIGKQEDLLLKDDKQMSPAYRKSENDNLIVDQGWQLESEEEITESLAEEAPQKDELMEESLDQVAFSSQPAFAGAVSDEITMDDTELDTDKAVMKKVDTKETIGLLTALY